MEENFKKGKVVIYKSSKGPEIQVRLEKNTVWLDAHLIAKLFGVNRPAIVKHINNIYKSGELIKKSTCSILEQIAKDGKLRKMNLYNLDVIISVGYRVNSKKATQFRIWATKILKKHLIKGYTINEKRLLQIKNNFIELQNTISFLQEKSKHQLFSGQEQEILSLLTSYSRTLTILEQYDKGKLKLTKKTKSIFILKYEETKKIIEEIKKELILKKEASNLFGLEIDKKFQAILGNIYQSFNGKELYPSLEEKAAHFLYFVIKDHPFIDGNKRIGSFLFVYFLDKNNYLYRENGEKKINDNALIALSILIAVSDSKDKEMLIKIITNILESQNFKINFGIFFIVESVYSKRKVILLNFIFNKYIDTLKAIKNRLNDYLKNKEGIFSTEILLRQLRQENGGGKNFTPLEKVFREAVKNRKALSDKLK